MTENSRERFKRLAEKRTNKVITTLRLLGNLSNKGNYDYEKKDIDKIFFALNKELKQCQAQFDKKPEETSNEFKLD